MKVNHRIPVMENGEPKRNERGRRVFEEEEWVFTRKKQFGGPEDIKIATAEKDGTTVIEVAIPNADETFPLRIGPNHTFAQAIYVGIPGRGAVSVYEPYAFFQVTAE